MIVKCATDTGFPFKEVHYGVSVIAIRISGKVRAVITF